MKKHWYTIDYPDKIYERFDKIIEENQALSVRDLNINGYDLMDLGLKGKQIGECLDYLVEEVLEDATLNNHEKLIELAKSFVEKS